jgi:hypothetical protein
MVRFVMKYLWCGQWINFDVEHWDDGLVNFGRTIYRREPPPENEPIDPTQENGFQVMTVELSATKVEEAKREAWRNWEERPYRDEAQGYLIDDTSVEPPASTVHSYLMGWDKTPAGEIETPPEPRSYRERHSLDGVER